MTESSCELRSNEVSGVNTLVEKRFLELPKPTEGDFRADRERILDALQDEAYLPLQVMRTLYPLVSQADYAVTVTLAPGEQGKEIIRVEAGNTTNCLYGAALDIGSTTLELEILDLHTGRVLTNVGCINSQTQFGLNILDRILAVKEDVRNLQKLQELTAGDINTLVEEACDRCGLCPADISALAVGGNTTMIHFFTGCDPWLVFQNPYAPVFFDPGTLHARDLGLNLTCNVYCFPAVANYLGGDITAGLLLTDLDTGEKPSIFLDIGTNGELALGCRDYLLVGAGAAGPALEGFGSACGMRAESGAVRHLNIDADGNIHLEVIGGGKPKGICGTGIFDLVAESFLAGWLAGDGRINLGVHDCLTTVWNPETLQYQNAIVFYEDADTRLYFTQEDIREFIKCKAAAHTMVATLLDHCGLTLNDVDKFYLAGGFGTHIRLESAITVGIYPDVSRERLVILGNTSLAGAKKRLMDDSCMDRIRGLMTHATYLQFGEMDKFLENMIAAEFLPHTDGTLYPSVRVRKGAEV